MTDNGRRGQAGTTCDQGADEQCSSHDALCDTKVAGVFREKKGLVGHEQGCKECIRSNMLLRMLASLPTDANQGMHARERQTDEQTKSGGGGDK